MAHPPDWIASTDELAAALSQVGRGPLGLDTEADSLHHYPEKVCLVQLSFAGRDLLVDPLAEIDMAPLEPPLIDPDVRKVLHGADYDLRGLDRDFSLGMRGLFDTMIAARLTGERSFGLAALLERFFGVRLEKRFQRADWSLRPLSAEMQDYARHDTAHLVELADLLEQRLNELGRRGWAEEEFQRLEQVRWSSTADDPERYRRVKGSSHLSPRGLAILSELYRLRETAAVELDRPAFKVLQDSVLLGLAEEAPQTPSALRHGASLPERWQRPRYSARLLDAVARAMRLPPDRLPSRPGARRLARDAAFDRRVRELSTARDRLAQELDLEPSLIAPRAVLEGAQRLIDTGGNPRETPELRRWQASLLWPEP
jgi:ribonuclease D